MKTIWFHPPAMGRDSFCYRGSLKAPSTSALNTSGDGASIASLGDDQKVQETKRG